MGDFAAVIVGLGIGFLIGLPALVVYRRDIVRNFRRLVTSPEAGSGHAQTAPQPQHLSGAGDVEADGLSPMIATFGVGAGMLTALYGALSGGVIFLASGIFVGLSVGVAFIASRAVKG